MNPSPHAPHADLSFRPVVVVPAFDHGAGVSALLASVDALGLPMIVVDDGSRDDTPRRLRDWGESAGVAPRIVRTHLRNRGKGSALRTGFESAADLGATHAVTIDADGQLSPEDIPALLDAARANPRALVLGRRPERIDGQPGRCAFGRWCADLAIRGECGVRVSDSQCGLRVYPIELVRAVRCFGGRFSFEAEVITRAAWAGFPIVELPVRCRYFPPAERVSHFRPWRDSLRQGALHLLLLLRALAPWPHRRYVAERPSAAPPPILTRLWLGVKRLGQWLNPIQCWREAKAGELGRLELAAALGVGVWIGTVPIYGAQTAACLYVAWRLHLHPAAVVLGSQVSLPPIGIALAFASTWIGHVLLEGRPPRSSDISFEWSAAPAMMEQFLPALGLGSVIVGLIVGVGVFALVAAWPRRAPAVSGAR